jgi:magnesium chelatase family protein
LSEEHNNESSVEIRKRMTSARQLQTIRFNRNEKAHYNAQMNAKQIKEF